MPTAVEMDFVRLNAVALQIREIATRVLCDGSVRTRGRNESMALLERAVGGVLAGQPGAPVPMSKREVWVENGAISDIASGIALGFTDYHAYLHWLSRRALFPGTPSFNDATSIFSAPTDYVYGLIEHVGGGGAMFTFVSLQALPYWSKIPPVASWAQIATAGPVMSHADAATFHAASPAGTKTFTARYVAIAMNAADPATILAPLAF